MDNAILKTVEYTSAGEDFIPKTERIIRESALEIRLNGKTLATAMILAGMEKEFVIGHLFSQGIISGTRDITSITVDNGIAEVALTEEGVLKQPSAVVSDLQIPAARVFECVRAILKSEVFTETEAVHSAGLFLNGQEPVSITEDLGRHHALDKAIGGALLEDIDFGQVLAASTGRQPAEMILKCRNAGIPFIATKGVPTAMAVSLAKRYGITIAGLVRGDTMTVYSYPQRII